MSYVITLVAARDALSAATIARVREATGGGATDTLSAGEAADIACPSRPDPARLADAIGAEPVDALVVTREGRRKRLLVADMDSTVVTSETLDELAAHAGLKDRVAAITRRSMSGKIDFAEALRERVALLRGLDLAALEQTWARTRITPGAAELVATMRAHGAVTALVSGGFSFFAARVAQALGFDEHRANRLHDDGAVLLGTVAEPILDRAAKLASLREMASAHGLALSETLAVGDGANDLEMIAAAGLGVAFRAKPVVAEAARSRVTHGDLRALLFAQGYRASEFQSGQSQSDKSQPG